MKKKKKKLISLFLSLIIFLIVFFAPSVARTVCGFLGSLFRRLRSRRTVVYMLPRNHFDTKSYNSSTSLPRSHPVLSHHLCPEVWLPLALLIFEKTSNPYEEAWSSCLCLSLLLQALVMQHFQRAEPTPPVRWALVWSFSVCRRQAQGGADILRRWAGYTEIAARIKIRCPESLCLYYMKFRINRNTKWKDPVSDP